jgi:hypothetical protein
VVMQRLAKPRRLITVHRFESCTLRQSLLLMMKSFNNTTPAKLALSIVFYITLVFMVRFMWVNSSQDKFQNDARVYYLAGQLLRNGGITKIYNFQYQNELHQQLVENKHTSILFLNTPVSAVVFVPLVSLSYLDFYRALIVLNTVLLGFAVYYLCKKLHLNKEVSAALIFFLPVASAVFHSQLTALILVVYVLCIVSLDRPKLAGLFAGFLFLKPQHLLLVPFVLVILKSWKERKLFVVGFVPVFLALFSANILLYGPKVYSDYFSYMQNRQVSLIQKEAYEGYNLRSFSAWLDPVFGYERVSLVITIVEIALYVTCLVFVSGKKLTQKQEICAAIIFTLVLNVQTKYADLLMLIPVILILLDYAWSQFALERKLRSPLKQLLAPLLILLIPIFCFTHYYILAASLLILIGFCILGRAHGEVA